MIMDVLGTPPDDFMSKISSESVSRLIYLLIFSLSLFSLNFFLLKISNLNICVFNQNCSFIFFLSFITKIWYDIRVVFLFRIFCFLNV